MLLNIMRLLQNKYNLTYKDAVNLILFMQDCNDDFDNLNYLYDFIKNYTDNMDDFIALSKYEYIQ